MGKYDLVEQALAEFKAEFFFTGVQIQPGRPVVFGRIPHRNRGFSPPSHTHISSACPETQFRPW